MTKQDFEEIIELICPHCQDGNEARFRPDTKEFVHDKVAKLPGTFSSHFTHTICWASRFRQSRFNPNG